MHAGLPRCAAAPSRSSRSGKPGDQVGITCGTSVTQGLPATCAASAVAIVRMSATTISGSYSRISGSLSRAAFTAAA